MFCKSFIWQALQDWIARPKHSGLLKSLNKRFVPGKLTEGVCQVGFWAECWSMLSAYMLLIALPYSPISLGPSQSRPRPVDVVLA